jgi:hypothetical protein
MRTRHLASVALTAALALAAVAPAGAQSAEQTITGTIGSSISASLSQPAVTQNLVVGANTIDGGSLTVASNLLSTVSVAFDRTAMTRIDEGGAYVTGALGSPLALTATGTGGASLGTATSATNGLLISALGLGSTTINLGYAQPVTLTDAPGTYRIRVTYTAASSL